MSYCGRDKDYRLELPNVVLVERLFLLLFVPMVAERSMTLGPSFGLNRRRFRPEEGSRMGRC